MTGQKYLGKQLHEMWKMNFSLTILRSSIILLTLYLLVNDCLNGSLILNFSPLSLIENQFELIAGLYSIPSP